jgi:hypothetical protein
MDTPLFDIATLRRQPITLVTTLADGSDPSAHRPR